MLYLIQKGNKPLPNQTSQATKTVLTISDLHVGSKVALSTNSRTDSYSNLRKKIFNVWEKMTTDYSEPDLLILGGDLIDGQNRKEGGIGTTTNDLLEQADEAVELIKQIKAKQTIVVRGSQYHVSPHGTGLQIEEYIARQLDAQPHPIEKGNHSAWHWFVTVNGYTFHIHHKISVPRVWHYKSTPLARAMMMTKLHNSLRGEMAKYRVNCVLRAHCHSFIAVEYATTLGMTLPCWKVLDDYLEREDPLSYIPDIGFVTWQIDESGNANWTKHIFKCEDIQKPPHIVI